MGTSWDPTEYSWTSVGSKTIVLVLVLVLFLGLVLVLALVLVLVLVPGTYSAANK